MNADSGIVNPDSGNRPKSFTIKRNDRSRSPGIGVHDETEWSFTMVRNTQRAGLEELHFHDLRHEAATRLFERGLNIMEVATITGHKDLRMLRRYTHLKAEELARKLG